MEAKCLEKQKSGEAEVRELGVSQWSQWSQWSQGKCVRVVENGRIGLEARSELGCRLFQTHDTFLTTTTPCHYVQSLYHIRRHYGLLGLWFLFYLRNRVTMVPWYCAANAYVATFARLS